MRAHENYQRVVERARTCYIGGRDVATITRAELTLARLYSYAYRAHVIGAFHATKIAIAEFVVRHPHSSPDLQEAQSLLEELAARSLDPIAGDYRAVLSTFYRYDTTIRRTIDALQRSADNDDLREITGLFVAHIERISMSPGIACTHDNCVPEQASFVVPNLGITIVPLVYGDHHSWNVAYLSPRAPDVPRHKHQSGVEIHLGIGHVHGYTLLGAEYTDVNDGYAMAIPAQTAHGFQNLSAEEHYLPFIFGSKTLGGWGICPDVQSQPISLESLRRVPRTDSCLNGLVRLTDEIEKSAARAKDLRRTLINSSATYHPDSGALVLAITRVSEKGLVFPLGGYRIISVVRGEGTASIDSISVPVSAHDHFGVPAGLSCTLRASHSSPMVVLDAVFVS